MNFFRRNCHFIQSVWTFDDMFRRGIKGIFIFVVATLDTFIFIPVYLITVLLLRPWRNIVPKLYWTFESCIFRELMFTVGHWSWMSGVKILEFGDNPEDYVTERCLVVVNHQSTADVMTLLTTLAQKFPCGGQGREKRHLQSEFLRAHLERKYWSRGRNWIMLFPEGGFLYKRLESSKQYALKNGYPIMDHVTLPRIGAVKTVIDTCRSYKVEDAFDRQVRYLIDVTIIYEKIDKPLNILDFITGLRSPTTIRVVYNAQPASLLPSDEEPLLERMYQIWEQKEKMMAEYYRTGQIPGHPDKEARTLNFSYTRFFVQRAVFYSLGYLYFKMSVFLFKSMFGLI
uniref:Acyltransferase C-terminal domain-containing protein n=1 Tax=Romanomermis culicivorax TaxID=13658 RepID=A0A915I7M4_ROMCU